MRTLARTAVMLALVGFMLVAGALPASAAPPGSAETTVATTGEVGLQSSALATGSTVTVAGTRGWGLRLRSGPGLGYTIQLVMPEGAALAVLGEVRLADGYWWYPVAYGGRSGWAAGAYLALGAAAAPKAAPAPAPSGPNAWDGLLQQHFGAEWQFAKRVMLCESGGNPAARNTTPPDYSIGLFQINLYGANAQYRPSEAYLLDGANNIAYAAQLRRASGWGPWGTCAR